MSTLDILSQYAEEQSPANQPFGPYQEESIIALALDYPEFVTGVIRFLKPEMFKRLECRFVIAQILNMYEQYGVVPTRAILKDTLESSLTSSDPFEIILPIVEKKSNPRDIPIIKDTLLKWAKVRAYGLLYSEEALEAYNNEDFEFIEKIVNEANRIADVGDKGFWFLENFEILFLPDTIEHRTTGFPRLDHILNNGGPSPKEVVCWLAPTNVGKSVLLVNNAISSLRGHTGDGRTGQDVLFITFEMDVLKTALRAMGTATGIPTDQVMEHQEMIRRMLTSMKNTYNKKLLIHEMAPDECSVAHIYALLDSLKRREGWRPDVVILDYMDLMVSRNPSYNTDDYTRQKHVANEIRGLAKNENVLVFTATQTNRSGASGVGEADLTNAAESYAKQFALDYVISLNQTQNERIAKPPRIRMFVAKNRNGSKHVTIECEINYDTMIVREL
jgi:replicative DNA helicase